MTPEEYHQRLSVASTCLLLHPSIHPPVHTHVHTHTRKDKEKSTTTREVKEFEQKKKWKHINFFYIFYLLFESVFHLYSIFFYSFSLPLPSLTPPPSSAGALPHKRPPLTFMSFNVCVTPLDFVISVYISIARWYFLEPGYFSMGTPLRKCHPFLLINHRTNFLWNRQGLMRSSPAMLKYWQAQPQADLMQGCTAVGFLTAISSRGEEAEGATGSFVRSPWAQTETAPWETDFSDQLNFIPESKEYIELGSLRTNPNFN